MRSAPFRPREKKKPEKLLISRVEFLFKFLVLFFKLEYGEEMWSRVLQAAGCRHTVFNTHQVYADTLITDLAAGCAQMTTSTVDQFMQFFGRCFVRYFSNFGYQSVPNLLADMKAFLF